MLQWPDLRKMIEKHLIKLVLQHYDETKCWHFDLHATTTAADPLSWMMLSFTCLPYTLSARIAWDVFCIKNMCEYCWPNAAHDICPDVSHKNTRNEMVCSNIHFLTYTVIVCDSLTKQSVYKGFVHKRPKILHMYHPKHILNIKCVILRIKDMKKEQIYYNLIDASDAWIRPNPDLHWQLKDRSWNRINLTK